jgi:hypothetical protein
MSRLPHHARVALATVLTVVLVLSVAALAGAAPGKGKPGKPGKSAPSIAQYQYGKTKVQVCHKGKTITIAKPAEKAHLRHGDKPGPCP